MALASLRWLRRLLAEHMARGLERLGKGLRRDHLRLASRRRRALADWADCRTTCHWMSPVVTLRGNALHYQTLVHCHSPRKQGHLIASSKCDPTLVEELFLTTANRVCWSQGN